MKNSKKAKIPRKQILANEALQKRKARRSLNHTNNNDKQITESMIDDLITERAIDRIASLLPRGHGRKLNSQFRGGGQQDKNRPWLQIPYKPLKAHIGWLTSREQDTSNFMSLSEEIEKFAEYVNVRLHARCRSILYYRH